MIKLQIAHPFAVVREGLLSYLTNFKELEIVGQSQSSQELIHSKKEGWQADIIIVQFDLLRQNELDLQWLKDFTSAKIIVISHSLEDFWWLDQSISGAEGFILEDTSPAELRFAITQISEGKRYITPELAFLSIDKIPDTLRKVNPIVMTNRECEVLELIAEGYTNQEIADKIFTSKRTVEGHRQNLLQKTGSRNTARLIRFAINHGLVDAIPAPDENLPFSFR